MSRAATELNQRLGERVRSLRASRRLSLEDLAQRSGVSRSMISLIERGESSPTVVILDRLAAGLGVVLSSLFDDAYTTTSIKKQRVARRDEQAEWKDPASGYVRRNLSPAFVDQPMQLVEVRFPPGERVTFETGARDTIVFQQLWVIDGAIDVNVGDVQHHLHTGDCLAMQLDAPTVFHNPTRKATRYIVVTASNNTLSK